MAPAEVRARIAELADLEVTDVVGAAVGADNLRIAVLRQIATGKGDAVALASAAIEGIF